MKVQNFTTKIRLRLKQNISWDILITGKVKLKTRTGQDTSGIKDESSNF